MTLAQFWEHIQKSKRKDADAHAERLTKRLTKLLVAEILDFDRCWDQLHGQAESWNLRGAAYIINGGCSDDGFDYFRGWLILQGRKVYEAALKNPDSLADVLDPGEEFCELGGRPGWDAWFQATGTEQDEAGYDALIAALESKSRKTGKKRGMGRSWDFENDKKMQKKYPRLWALYMNTDGGE